MAGRLFSIRRLRWALVAGAVVLVAVLAWYIGYARYKLRGSIRDAAARLGLEYNQETDSYTYAYTRKNVTQWKLHAARHVQHKDGHITLYNVGMDLFGAKGDRNDHIHGDQFEYDQKTGVVTAVGDVYIDLTPPPPADGKPARGDEESRVLHVKTSGLVYQQKEQSATTDQPLEFRVGAMSGTAVGASYEAEKSLIVLDSQVRVSGLRGAGGAARGNERPMVLTASHAVLDRAANVTVLEAARLVSATDSGTQTASAVHAVIRMTSEGTPQHVDANGNVTLTGEGRGTVTADRLAMDLNATGQLSAAHLMGTVRFANKTEQKQEDAKADDARFAFDAQGRPVHATMTGAVEAELATKGAAGASTRWLSGDTLQLALAGGGKEPVEVHEAVATAAGGARMRLVDASTHKDAKGKAQPAIATTNVRADVLDAHFAEKTKVAQLTSVDGTGRTIVERTLNDRGADGSSGLMEWRETGNGDVLRVDFRANEKGGSEIARAEQKGSVKLLREAVAKADPKRAAGAAGMDVQHAQGDVAVYDAASDGMTLTGRVKVDDPESALFADRVTFDQGTGDATAEGAVRVSYLAQGSTGEAGGKEPVHVLAARAIGHKATGITEFFAAPGSNAKMWQGGSQVEAPVLDFDRSKRTVYAHDVSGAETQAVKTVLVDAKPAAAPRPGEKEKKQGGVVRVLSREMTYTDSTREVLFRGLVQVNDQDGVMHAQQATVYLAGKGTDAAAAPKEISLGGRVDHMIATGGVELDQPGRKATGEKLVYTASDRTFVLTGTKTAPPKMVDETQGTVAGVELRFRTGDDSVEVLSGEGPERVHTTTHMKQKN